MKRTIGDDVAVEFMHRRALEALQGLSRDEAVGMACSKAPGAQYAWVRNAWRRGVLGVKCCGLFHLLNPDRPDLPWPAVLFLVGLDGHPPQVASLSLYLGPDQEWTVVADEPVEQEDGSRRLVVAWRQYRGDPDGPPGLLNGDDAAGEPVRRTDPQASTQAAPPGTPRPSPSSGSSRGAARPSRGRSAGSRRRSTARAKPAEAAGRPSRLELLVELLRRLE